MFVIKFDFVQAENKDPYEDSSMQQKLLSDYNELLTALTAKDEKLINENWKRLNALQQQSTDNCKQTISVAR